MSGGARCPSLQQGTQLECLDRRALGAKGWCDEVHIEVYRHLPNSLILSDQQHLKRVYLVDS